MAAAKKKTKVQSVVADPVKQTESVLVFQAKQPMTVRAFEAAAAMLRSEQEATGIKIVLIPYSVEEVEKE